MRKTLFVLASASIGVITLIILVVARDRDRNELSDVESVTIAVKQLAPKGGSGVKKYHYNSGTLKEAAYWQDYNVTKIEYFDASGRRIYTANLSDGGGLLISLNDDGIVTEIYQTKKYVRDGARFLFDNGRLSKIIQIESDEVVDEVSLVPRGD